MSGLISRFGEMRDEMYRSGHRPGSWRVSQDVWDAMRLDTHEWMPTPTVAEPAETLGRGGFVYGLPAAIDRALPRNSVILDPAPEAGRA